MVIVKFWECHPWQISVYYLINSRVDQFAVAKATSASKAVSMSNMKPWANTSHFGIFVITVHAATSKLKDLVDMFAISPRLFPKCLASHDQHTALQLTQGLVERERENVATPASCPHIFWVRHETINKIAQPNKYKRKLCFLIPLLKPFPLRILQHVKQAAVGRSDSLLKYFNLNHLTSPATRNGHRNVIRKGPSGHLRRYPTSIDFFPSEGSMMSL